MNIICINFFEIFMIFYDFKKKIWFLIFKYKNQKNQIIYDFSTENHNQIIIWLWLFCYYSSRARLKRDSAAGGPVRDLGRLKCFSDFDLHLT